MADIRLATGEERKSLRATRREKMEGARAFFEAAGHTGKILEKKLEDYDKLILTPALEKAREMSIQQLLKIRRDEQARDVDAAKARGRGAKGSGIGTNLVQLPGARTFLAKAANSGLFNAGPSVVGALRAGTQFGAEMGQPLSGGFGERFNQAKEESEIALEALRREHPIAAVGGEIAGLATPFTPAGRALGLAGRGAVKGVDAAARGVTGAAQRAIPGLAGRGTPIGLGGIVAEAARPAGVGVAAAARGKVANITAEIAQNVAAASAAVATESATRNLLSGTGPTGEDIAFSARIQTIGNELDAARTNPLVVGLPLVAGVAQGVMRMPVADSVRRELLPAIRRLRQHGIELDPVTLTPDVVRPGTDFAGKVGNAAKASGVRRPVALRVEQIWSRPVRDSINRMRTLLAGNLRGARLENAGKAGPLRVAGTVPRESRGAVHAERTAAGEAAFLGSPGQTTMDPNVIAWTLREMGRIAKAHPDAAATRTVLKDLAKLSSLKAGTPSALRALEGGVPRVPGSSQAAGVLDSPASSGFTYQQFWDTMKRFDDLADMQRRFTVENSAMGFSRADQRASNKLRQLGRLVIERTNPPLDNALQNLTALRKMTEAMGPTAKVTARDADFEPIMNAITNPQQSFDRQWSALSSRMTLQERKEFAAAYLGEFLTKAMSESSVHGDRVLMQTAQKLFRRGAFKAEKFDRIFADAGMPGMRQYWTDMFTVQEHFAQEVLGAMGSQTGTRALDFAEMYMATAIPTSVLRFLIDQSRGYTQMVGNVERLVNAGFARTLIRSAISGGPFTQNLNKLALGQSVVGPTRIPAALSSVGPEVPAQVGNAAASVAGSVIDAGASLLQGDQQ